MLNVVHALGLVVIGTKEYMQINHLEHRVRHLCAYREVYSLGPVDIHREQTRPLAR
jgi:hypothetical protein